MQEHSCRHVGGGSRRKTIKRHVAFENKMIWDVLDHNSKNAWNRPFCIARQRIKEVNP
jgi:hypothetical protein